MRFHIITTTHNRASQFLTSAASWRKSIEYAGSQASLTVMDSSTYDDLSEQLLLLWPTATFQKSAPDTFWASGMALAEANLLGSGQVKDEDYLVWLNDDSLLDTDSFSRALRATRDHPLSILVCPLRAAGENVAVVGGLQSLKTNPLRFRLIATKNSASASDTFNGNFICVPAPLARRIGGICGELGHHYADLDYGLRNSRLGGLNITLAGTFGETSPTQAPMRDLSSFIRYYRSQKGSGNTGNRRLFLERQGYPRLFSTVFGFLVDLVVILRVSARLQFAIRRKPKCSVGDNFMQERKGIR